jgi:hypothetical protein
MHYSINLEEIKTEIEKLGHPVTNIWNVRQYGSMLPLSMLFIKLKTVRNNNDMYNVECIQQCKIQSNLPNTNGILLNVETVKKYGHTKNYCYNRDA